MEDPKSFGGANGWEEMDDDIVEGSPNVKGADKGGRGGTRGSSGQGRLGEWGFPGWRGDDDGVGCSFEEFLYRPSSKGVLGCGFRSSVVGVGGGRGKG